MSNYYRFYFRRYSDANENAFPLPVNPEKLPISRDNANDDYNVLGIGPIMIPRIPELKKVTITSYFPGRIDNLTLTADKFRTPDFYIDFFETAMLNKEIILYTPVRVYENGDSILVDDSGFDCLVTSFQYEERGGETGDFYYELELTEYRDYRPATITLTGETTETGEEIATTEESRNIPQGQLYVGARVIANGPYYYSSYGDEPYGNGNGKTCVVSRIITTDETRPYKVHITTETGGDLGWINAESLQVVSE